MPFRQAKPFNALFLQVILCLALSSSILLSFSTPASAATVQVTFVHTGLSVASRIGVLTVDGGTLVMYELPRTYTWNSGTLHSFTWLSPIQEYTTDNIRWIWVSTSGLSTAQTGTITPTGDGSVIGNYRTQYQLTIEVSPSGAGTTIPASGIYWYDSGSNVSISAAPNTGYKFNSWSGDQKGSSNPTSIILDRAKSVTANFVSGVQETRANPTVALVSSSQPGVAGATLTYAVSVKNNDPSSFGASTFSFTYSVPAGWSASLSKTSVTVSPGGTDSSTTLSVTSSSTASAGNYTVSATATNTGATSYLGSGTATYTVKVATPTLSVPAAPQNLRATPGDGKVTLAWDRPSSDGGSTITGYKIYRGTSSGGESLHTTLGITLTYSDPSVQNGVTYYYQVSAINAAGEGPRSSETSATPTTTVTAKPDLIISNFYWLPLDPRDGNDVAFTITVKNQGTSDSPSFTTALYIDSQRVDVGRTGLAVGQTQQFTYKWKSVTGNYKLKVIADDLGEVDESDEINNATSQSLAVVVAGTPTPTTPIYTVFPVEYVILSVALISFFILGGVVLYRRRKPELPQEKPEPLPAVTPPPVTFVAQGDVVLGGKQTVRVEDSVVIQRTIETGVTKCESCGNELKGHLASERVCPFCGADRHKL